MKDDSLNCWVRHRMLGVLVSLGFAVMAANPTSRNWVAEDGFVNDQTSWQSLTPPAQGTASAAGEMAYFTGSGDKTVRFPSGGWTDTGVYYFAKGLADGTMLTFDSTGSWWQFSPGTYFSNWQIFTLCGETAGASYPHILQVGFAGGAKATAPVFKLTDGVVKLVKDSVNGNVVSLERGEWNFRDSNGTVTDQNVLTLFNAAKSSGEDQVILRDGTALRAPAVTLTPGAAIQSARLVSEGGNHVIDELTIGASNGAVTTPATVELRGGSLDAGIVKVGTRTTTEANVLIVSNDTEFAAKSLRIGNTGKGASAKIVGSSTATVAQDVRLTTGSLTLADDAQMTVNGWFYPNYGMAAGNRSDVNVGGRGRLHLTATSDGSGAGTGGLYFSGNNGGGNATCAAVMRITDDAVVETAARTTIGHDISVSNVLEISGNGTFINSNASGVILGRGATGRGFMVVRDNATVNLTGGGASISLSGNLAWGDNIGAEARVDVLGGTVNGSGSLLLDGTNSCINLAGGVTTFKNWSVSGEPKYKIASEDWVLPTNTIRITGGVHNITGFNASGSSIMISATNGNVRVLMEGGEVNASSLITVGGGAMDGNPALMTVAGGKLTLAQRNNSLVGDSKIMVGQPGGSKGRFELLGGEVVANSIRGGGGKSAFVADGGVFTVLNAVAGDWALSRLTSAELGVGGLTVNVPSGVAAISKQTFTDCAGVDGLFVKAGVGSLVTSNASTHAITRVDAGLLKLAAGVTRFGRRLTIGGSGYVIVDVPSVAGTYDVLVLDAELSDGELSRVQPEVWADGFGYTATQREEGGSVIVSCVVTEDGPSARVVSSTTSFDEAQTLAKGLTVTGTTSVTFDAPASIVGTELVIDVATGAEVVFKKPIASAYTSVRKVGGGSVVFEAANPAFLGTWIQDGGVFDVRDGGFADAAFGLVLSRDTFKYSDAADGVLSLPVTIAAGSPQKRVVAQTDGNLTCANGWNSTGGGLVKTGTGTLTIVEPAGTFNLNTGSVAAGDAAVGTVPADGTAPADASVVQNGSTAGAALQILSGAVKVQGQGVGTTTVNNRQSIYIGTPYAATAHPGLEISNCTYVADGTTRSTILAAGAMGGEFTTPYLTIRDARYESHRMQIGTGSPSADVYPTVTVVDSEISFESGFNIGANSDRVHPRLLLDNAVVTQYRLGYAMGHYFYRDFDVTLMNGSLLNATYTSNAGANWHGIRFENGAWGVIRVTGGSKIQTSRIESLNAGATAEKHVDFIFDGGVLEMTGDSSSVAARTEFARPEFQGFTVGEAGMEVLIGEGVEHTFATPFRGDGAVVKSGTGVLALGTVPDGNPVFRTTGDVIAREGVIDLGGGIETQSLFAGGDGIVRNGTCAVRCPAEGEKFLLLGDGAVVGRVALTPPEGGWQRGMKVPVARCADGAEGVAVAARCRVETGDDNFRGTVAIEDNKVVVTVANRSGMTIILR